MIYRYSGSEIFVPDLDVESFTYQINLNKEIYRDIDGIDNYIDTWRTAILQTYTKEEKLYVPLTYNFFQTSLFFGQSEIRLHFDVDRANSLICHHSPSPISLSYFDVSNDFGAPIKYSKCTLTTSYQYECCDVPVILVPYFTHGFQFLVIDGNHRITAHKQKRIDLVHGVVLSPFESIMLLPTEFERSIYTFICEGENIQNFINRSSANRWL